MKRKVIVESAPDPSSTSIAKYLRENFFHADYSDGVIDDGKNFLYRIDDIHLNHDRIEEELAGRHIEPEFIIYLSKHSSSASIKSLTVHAMGNFGPADLGGLPGTLATSEPTAMTSALRILSEDPPGGFSVTFEATHHGPFTRVPSFFIEIGTEASDWTNVNALDAVSRAVMGCRIQDSSRFVGIGGGHYSPKITEATLANGYSIGHIISKHVHEGLNESMIDMAIGATPGFSGFVMDKKGSRGPVREKIKSKADEIGCELIVL